MGRCLTGTRVLQALRKLYARIPGLCGVLCPGYRIYIEKRLEMDGKMYMEPHGRWRQYTYLTERYFWLDIFACLQINFVFRKTWSILTVNFCIGAMFSLYNLESLKEI